MKWPNLHESYRRAIGAAWHEQVPLLQFLQPRAQVKAQKAGQCHGKVGVAMGIHSKLAGLQLFLADDTFNGHARLALVEHKGLRMEDAPAVPHVGVDADRRRITPRIQPGLPHPFGGLHAHHVRGRQIRPAPGGGDRVPLHEFQHSLAGLAQAPLVPRPAHSLADAGGRQLRNHARAFDRCQTGSMGHDAGIDHQQLVGRARLTPEHDPAEADLGVNGQNHFRQLHFTDAMVQGRAQFRDFRVFVLCGQCRQMEFIIHAQHATACCGGYRIDTGCDSGQQRLQESGRFARQG